MAISITGAGPRTWEQQMTRVGPPSQAVHVEGDSEGEVAAECRRLGSPWAAERVHETWAGSGRWRSISFTPAAS